MRVKKEGSVEEIEDRIISKEEELAVIQKRFGEESLYRDPTAARQLLEELQALTTDLAHLNQAWEQRADEAGT